MTQAIAPYSRADSPASKSISSIGQSPLRLFMAFPSHVSGRREYGLFRGPAPFESIPDKALVQPRLFSPASQNHGFSANCDMMVKASIAALFAKRSPSAIAGLVVAIVVNAVKGFTMRSVAHIGKEILKGVPAFADRDPAPPVVVVAGRRRAMAPVKHVLPNTPYRGFSHAVLRHFGLGHFRTQAAAGSNITTLQVVPADRHLLPALAKAKPAAFPVGNWGKRLQNGKAPKNPSCDVSKLCHGSQHIADCNIMSIMKKGNKINA